CCRCSRQRDQASVTACTGVKSNPAGSTCARRITARTAKEETISAVAAVGIESPQGDQILGDQGNGTAVASRSTVTATTAGPAPCATIAAGATVRILCVFVVRCGSATP